MKYQTHSTNVAIARVISFSVIAEKRARNIVCAIMCVHINYEHTIYTPTW